MTNYLTPKQAADLLGVKLTTLTNWRCRNQHLPYFKPSGKTVLYREEDVSSYIESTLKPISISIEGVE
jgi:excisionase family DNA binding protein